MNSSVYASLARILPGVVLAVCGIGNSTVAQERPGADDAFEQALSRGDVTRPAQRKPTMGKPTPPASPPQTNRMEPADHADADPPLPTGLPAMSRAMPMLTGIVKVTPQAVREATLACLKVVGTGPIAPSAMRALGWTTTSGPSDQYFHFTKGPGSAQIRTGKSGMEATTCTVSGVISGTTEQAAVEQALVIRFDPGAQATGRLAPFGSRRWATGTAGMLLSFAQLSRGGTWRVLVIVAPSQTLDR